MLMWRSRGGVRRGICVGLGGGGSGKVEVGLEGVLVEKVEIK
jgi:hypothetical protein